LKSFEESVHKGLKKYTDYSTRAASTHVYQLFN
jgi:hypothetical protein